AIAWGILSGKSTDPDHPRKAYFTHIYWATHDTGTSLAATGRPPFGAVDGLVGGAGKVNLSGWTIDPDMARTALSVHVYLGAPASSGDRYTLTADQVRNDVANAYPSTGNQHGFSGQLTTSRRGSVPVYVYAINVGGGSSGNPLIGSGTVTVS
ncbi:MAG: hypothetical protein LBK59_07685, partial [Bifidobacteriaceae bacterium]|nr:hypothetical protein [Bifidobacteriaceae bacterium]